MADPARQALDAVVTHHRDGFRSGVARFNELLANRLRAPLLGIDELEDRRPGCALLSFKVGELDPFSAESLGRWLEPAPCYELFLHDYGGTEVERSLVEGARHVHCGNSEIEAAVAGLARSAGTLWTPGLILDDRTFRPSEISVFSFGMAHKLRTDMFRRLRALLEASGRSYALYVSAANHETASLRDSEIVFEEMHEIFPEELYFLGNLSDVAVSNYLGSTTFFAAFFPGGVRANNTSVASAMERGAVVITNFDEHSPRDYVHMENMIDIARCEELPFDPATLAGLGATAVAVARSRGWNTLVDRLRK